ncbi:histidine kinase [Arcicella aurantiaca]|uniref:Oxygen sensor histidine kinase NreB n=1 Tax=Arcicella aurantiaca TaxID=591202 RepID=A0A316DW57_9BACT|nr:sensor histidine kinase [Arcicella aurantiaca]PWK22155.1 histidine kinase [Arcicella aurantiaca]
MNEVKIIILGTAAMLLPTSAIIIFVILYYRRQRLQREKLEHIEELHRQEMLEASVASQENVRRQIGGDLHDEIGTLLSATRMSLSQITKYGDNPSKRENLLNQTQDLLNEALNNVRRISKELMPSTLDEFGLIIALKDFTQKMTEHTGVMVCFSHGELVGKFDSKIELALYRTAQELVNNALKHAQATIINLTLSESNNQLVLQVSDNGIGFDLEEVNQPNRGIGIKNIESRISVIKGHIKFDVEKGRGASFEISVPL